MPKDNGADGSNKGWQPELDELRERERQARAMGGPDKVRRQHDGGRLTIRERIGSWSIRARCARSAPLPAWPSYDGRNRLQSFTPSNRDLRPRHASTAGR